MNLAKWWDTKSTFRNQKHFCTPTMKYQKQKLGENPTYYRNKKNKILKNKHNEGSERPILRKLQNTKERN